MIDIALDPELAAVVRRWTADGEMDFRWPADNEDLWEIAARFWRLPSPLLNLAHINDRSNDSSVGKAIDSLRKANEGAAIEAFLEYWDAVPRRNAEDLLAAYAGLHKAMVFVSVLLDEYKMSIVRGLEALKEALDKTYRWKWWPLADHAAMERDARALVNEFDAKLATLRSSFKSELYQKWDEHKPDASLLRAMAKPIPKNLHFDK